MYEGIDWIVPNLSMSTLDTDCEILFSTQHGILRLKESDYTLFCYEANYSDESKDWDENEWKEFEARYTYELSIILEVLKGYVHSVRMDEYSNDTLKSYLKIN